MDKNAIKKYAVWARRELISRVTQRALKYGISEKEIIPAKETSIHGVALSPTEIAQRTALISQINNKGFEQVMEEVAYTWFNRFSALRFMEVNGYLPTHVRVFTDDENNFKPQIMTEAINLEMDGLDMERVYAMKDANDNDALFKYLIITQCNALSSILPGMFQKIDDYTEVLFPDNLLREGSVIEQMITLIPEEDWTDQVQIIGWLYQYYNSEPKDAVFAALKKNVKISKENIPAATQLFTPDWIVRYMVENSLGRLWLEGHPNDALKSQWKYYLDEAEQEAEVRKQLEEIRKEYARLKPEEIRCIDPCMGSGHILCYMFDVLVKIYEDYGYTAREAVTNIVEKNLWGLDIDERAAQLSYFAVMMKARQYDRRFFNKKDENGEISIPQPHVYAIEESNGITTAPLHDMGIGLSQEDYGKAVKQIIKLIEEFHDAKEYGSIINVSTADWDLLRKFAIPRWEDEGGQIEMNIHGEVEAAPRLQGLFNLGQALSQKYHAVVTNPPYMGGSGMDSKLSDYVKKNYPDSKSDLSTVSMEKTLALCTPDGYMSMINIPVWMFLSSYEKLREKIIYKNTIVNMVHPGRGIFGSDFGTTSFVIGKKYVEKYKGHYRRLFEKQGEVESVEEREKRFFEGVGKYTAAQCEFAKIPGSPVAYWASQAILSSFKNGMPLSTVAYPKQGIKTANKDKFLRLWHEIENNKMSVFDDNAKWFPCNKGGSFRKWFGNNEYVVDWENDGYNICNHRSSEGKLLSRPQNLQYMLKEGITYTNISISSFGARYSPKGFIYDAAGSGIFCDNTETLLYALAFLTSKVAAAITRITSPTMSFEVGQISILPLLLQPSDVITNTVQKAIKLSKTDWDSFETSWDFARHPLVRQVPTVADAYTAWQRECDDRFAQLKANEEELNRIFIDIYGLQDELTPEVEDKDVTVRKAELQRDIKSLISYAVGCMFGRYSVLEDGLIYAGGDWPPYDKAVGIREKYFPNADQRICSWMDVYGNYIPDEDNIIPISDDEYFGDDIASRFVEFIKVVFGEETLEENLKFIADALGGKGTSREVIRNYFINDFYADHLKVYQKRSIYWLFDSGKKNGFKCLIYMHRYQPDTIARIRTDYVHEQQSRYRTSIADLEKRVASASTSEKVKLTKQLSKLQDQAAELHEYEEKIHHLADQYISIDLDDGVKVNYAKFQDVLAKIK